MGRIASPYFATSSSSAARFRAVAATWSPRSRAAIAHSRPKPRDVPVINHVFMSRALPSTAIASFLSRQFTDRTISFDHMPASSVNELLLVASGYGSAQGLRGTAVLALARSRGRRRTLDAADHARRVLRRAPLRRLRRAPGGAARRPHRAPRGLA